MSEQVICDNCGTLLTAHQPVTLQSPVTFAAAKNGPLTVNLNIAVTPANSSNDICIACAIGAVTSGMTFNAVQAYMAPPAPTPTPTPAASS